MQLGIFAKTFSASGAAASLAAARDAGFETVQFNMAVLGGDPMPNAIDPSSSTAIVNASRETGVSIAAISGTYNMIHPDPARRAAGMGRLGVLMEAAATMGIGMVTLCTGTRDPDDQWRHHPDNASSEAWRDLFVEVQKAVALADAYGIDLGIEPELANVVSSASHARKLIDEVGSPRLRIVLDPANLAEGGTTQETCILVDQAVSLLGDRIAMAHAKDRDAGGRVVAAGKGVIDFRHFVGCLRDADFTGPLVTHGLAEAEAPAVARFLHTTLAEAGAA